MSGHVKRYRYYCEDERAWIDEDSAEIPTVCKNNRNHRIKEGSIYIQSRGYCEIVPISGVEELSGDCELGDANMENIVEKFNKLARRVKLLEKCAQLNGLLKFV